MLVVRANYFICVLTATSVLLDAIDVAQSFQSTLPTAGISATSRSPYFYSIRRTDRSRKSSTSGTSTILRGIDFDAIEDDEECDLFTGAADIVDPNRPDTASFCIPQPTPDLTPEEVVNLCMDTLKDNDNPTTNAGLEICFNFSSDRCRAANGGTLQDFIKFAGNPTFQSLINAVEWKTLSVGSEIPGTPTRGAMKTILVTVQPREYGGDGTGTLPLKERKFLWTMQRERRPPRSGCWLVHECIAVDKAFAQTL
mmetsp:Transcript_25338/g.29845  ORF Transcript_25338/g.29845 Transcript_25338/m.29845 type:complete len:254 (+) Transcript_25338:87-848(+)